MARRIYVHVATNKVGSETKRDIGFSSDLWDELTDEQKQIEIDIAASEMINVWTTEEGED